ncbi:thiJ/pfpI family protein [Haloarcula hispanica N601]|uniref:ThiJ/pfpI family protein n=2 Tax=Haloarcula hispanica TaxID=51589 RepID=V5TQC6_HALHI|nr:MULTISPECIES: type 1 glutamine amidotransferase domain-containing protein [Haloarcula]AEM58579.1 ThiJ/PfpI domain protein [Haloarcula hispanica ATCC 33960]AHB67303.1 thiJ/pfpI family protein [Haloarcula hispanica N601]AJF25565.1 thiamine biosynthesis protein ThiJ [Haloarcula sp. CBA1115]KAA9405791.1 type 1 glutamine amidotransferase domain-containing protein [Haloarcula sp. CBA1131]KZX46915.1 thiamine biosynthesis protein ThiJ [Haloarcula sp. K1]
MSSALFVVSEHGYWGEECIEPLTTLSDAGLDITVATPTGEPPVLDERSVDPEEVGEDLSEHVREVHETDERLNNPIPLAQADAEDYDTVVFPGGHGAEWDITQDVHARELLRESVAGDDGKALVVCHTVGILAFTRNADGEFLADGRSVTGFPNAWEEGIVDENDLLPDGRKLPYWVEDEVKAVGADWDAELDADTSVTVDGDLITARGPPSSAAAARTLLDELGIETSA